MAVLITITRSTDDTGAFEQQVTLDGVTYTLKFRWNVRGMRADVDGNQLPGAWEMHVFDAEGTTAHQVGLVLRADWPVDVYLPGRIPAGVFIPIDTGAPVGEGEDPDFDDLGNRSQLHYFSISDFL